MAGLAPSFGRGAMTNHWVDIRNADLIIVTGGNAAEAHPVGFRWAIEAKKRRGAKLISIDPRFTRTSSVADIYAPIRTGTDITFWGALIKYLLDNNKIQHEYVRNYTDFSYIVRDDFDFNAGIYSGYNEETRTYDRSTWEYALDEETGFVKQDPTLRHPRSVYQLLRKHYERYTPEMVERVCGTPKEKFLEIAELVASTSVPNRNMTILYALGWTQHSIGAQIIRTAAMLQLLLGNIGQAGGGINALRGHSNIQGLTDLGLMTDLLPGYLTLPRDGETFEGYLAARTPTPMRENQLNYWGNYKKFFVSLAKAWYGKSAHAGNNFCFDWLPKLDKPYDMLRVYEMMSKGEMHGYFCQGFNPLAAVPHKKKQIEAFSKLKFMVTMDPLNTETAEFWRNAGEENDVDTASIQTEVFRLPTTCFAEGSGAEVNSGRVLQWHWKGANPPGEAKSDIEIMSRLYQRIKELYEEEGGAFPDPILNLDWPYAQRHEPTSEELAKELNGRALVDLSPTRKAGQQLSGFAELKDDGSTSCGCWIYSGCYTEAGNMMARRDNSDPTGIGQSLNWAWAWPANRRILYNRASADPSGKPWDPERALVYWNGRAWVGADVPDYKADEHPANGMGPFIMNAEGTGRLFARKGMAEGPFPEHYEPFETPLSSNPLNPDEPRALNNPGARVFKRDLEDMGKADEFPHVATTYRLTEHFHYWTKNVHLNAITQPEQFVEIGEDLADELGIKAGDRVKVSSKRDYIKAVAVVTKRLASLNIDGKKVHQVGVPLHWGFVGVAKKGFLANSLTPAVGDGNTQTPEFKSFLVNVEKI